MNNQTPTESNILIKEIKCPELNQAGFASDLESAFNKINDNFYHLANYDFVNGDINFSSSSFIKIESIPIFDDDGSDEGKITNSLCKELKTFLKSLLGNQKESIVVGNDTFSYFDNFTKDTAGSLHVIYGNVNGEDVAFSTLQYVFLDGRFWNNDIGRIDSSEFNNLYDMSCVVVYDKDNGFRSLNDAFPTIYYEHHIGLCWKIHGKKTGITIQGLPGIEGKLNYEAMKEFYSNSLLQNRTILCKNGIVIKQNDEIIGLGMKNTKNDPTAELYYSYRDEYANNKRISKSISLKELFKKLESFK